MPNYSILNPRPGFLSSLNYPGSSGYGTSRGRYGQDWATTQAATTDARPDYAVYNTSTGRYESIKTGQPWTGKLPGGQVTKNGVIDNTTTDPNDPNRYKAVSVIKDQTGATQADTLSTQFDKTSNDLLKGWDSYVSDYKTQTDAAKKASAAAANINPTIADLTGAQQRYSAGLDTTSANYAAMNADAAARQRANIAQQQADLTGYDEAKNREQAVALGAAEKLVSRYGLGKNAAAGGVNLGLGGDVASLALNEAYKASIPIDLAKEQRRYDIANTALGLEGRLQGAEATRIGSFEPSRLGAQYSSATDTASRVQNLRQAVANQDWQTASQIMNIPEVQAQVRQAILNGDSQMLAALQQLRANARYQGLQDTQGVDVSQPQYYSTATGRYPTTTASTFNMGGSQFGGGGTGTSGGSVNPAISELYGGRYDNLTQAQIQARNTAQNRAANATGGVYGNFYTPGEQTGTYDYGYGTQYPGGGGYYLGTDQSGQPVGTSYQQYF